MTKYNVVLWTGSWNRKKPFVEKKSSNPNKGCSLVNSKVLMLLSYFDRSAMVMQYIDIRGNQVKGIEDHFALISKLLLLI